MRIFVLIGEQPDLSQDTQCLFTEARLGVHSQMDCHILATTYLTVLGVGKTFDARYQLASINKHTIYCVWAPFTNRPQCTSPST